MEQISSHNSSMGHQNQTLQCHISYNTIALQSARKSPQSIGIPRNMKHRLQCILAYICLLRQGRGNLLICCMRMGSVSPTPGSWKSQPSLERQYSEALSGLIPYFFANNNVNYTRWLPVRLKDMISLEQQHPEVAREFHKGNFVVHKSRRELSAIAINQAHEQNNAVIKGDGGAVGLTEDPGALQRWMVAGSELSRLIAGYEAMSGVKDAAISSKHHE